MITSTLPFPLDFQAINPLKYLDEKAGEGLHMK